MGNLYLLFAAVRLNSKLAEELGSAKKELEILKGRLKELEVSKILRNQHYIIYYHCCMFLNKITNSNCSCIK